MPPQPKRKYPKSRQGKRRSHLALKATALVPCSHCGTMKLPHHVCPNCGYYAGREAIKVKGQKAKA